MQGLNPRPSGADINMQGPPEIQPETEPDTSTSNPKPIIPARGGWDIPPELTLTWKSPQRYRGHCRAPTRGVFWEAPRIRYGPLPN